ncbi:MAG: nuclear transport factor 2 family protein [Planctomycetes bacterium]|nr:nuclear transport factor 2 family protein [Planctomycetota bacterium]
MTAISKRLPQPVAAYIRATNEHDVAAFIACFTEDAEVNDAAREFRGIEAIRAWSEREIVAPRVTLEVLDVAKINGEVIVTTKVDGNFDRTGLPDPVIIDHHVTLANERICRLTCVLAGAGKPA